MIKLILPVIGLVGRWLTPSALIYLWSQLSNTCDPVFAHILNVSTTNSSIQQLELYQHNVSVSAIWEIAGYCPIPRVSVSMIYVRPTDSNNAMIEYKHIPANIFINSHDLGMCEFNNQRGISIDSWTDCINIDKYPVYDYWPVTDSANNNHESLVLRVDNSEIYHNYTNNDSTNSYILTQGTVQCSPDESDFQFALGLSGTYTWPQTDKNVENGQFGCTYNGCYILKSWKIAGICQRPKLKVSVMNMNYEYSKLGPIEVEINGDDNTMHCNVDDWIGNYPQNCTNSHPLISCINNDDLSSYIDTSANLNNINHIYLHVSSKDNVNISCPYTDINTNKSYYLLVDVSISCYVPDQCLLDTDLPQIISVIMIALFGTTAVVVVISGVCAAYKRGLEQMHHGNSKFDLKFCHFLPIEIWKKKSCYLPCVTHLIDQATDIAVIFEFYELYQFENIPNPNGTKNDCSGVDGAQLLLLSCFALIFYRVVSCIWIYRITKSLFHTSLQFLDLKIYQALYINFISQHNDGKPNTAQKYLQILEASLEAFPQVVIQLYFFIQVQMDIKQYWIVFASLIMSLYNVSSKMASEDTIYFIDAWKNFTHANRVNIRFLFRFIVRLFDVFHRIFLILLLWIGIDGLYCAAYIFFEIGILSIISFCTKDLSVLIAISQTPFQICQSLKHWKWWYVLFVLYRVLISVGVIVLIHSQTIHTRTINVAFLWIFSGISLFVHIAIARLHSFKIIKPLEGSTDRTVKHLLKNDLIQDVMELEMFGSRIDMTRTMSVFRHSNHESLWVRAFKSANIKDMKYLLSIDSNININDTDSKNATPIIYASIHGNVDVVKLLLNQSGIDVNHCDIEGNTALWYAARHGYLEIVILLLDSGASINLSNRKTKQTPLMVSLKHKKYKTASWMLANGLKYGLDTTKKDIRDNTAWAYCWRHNSMNAENVETTKMYINYHMDNNITWDVNERCNVNIDQDPDTGGQTVFMIAALSGDSNIVDYYIQIAASVGLDITIRDSIGRTAWNYCCKSGNLELIHEYERFSKSNNLEWTANDAILKGRELLHAIKNGNQSLSRYLLKNSNYFNMDTSITDENNQTPWVYCWKTKTADLIIDYIEYHQHNSIKWDMFELDLHRNDNALTYNFAKIFNKQVMGLYDEEITLFEVLVNPFVDELIRCSKTKAIFKWPTNSRGTLLTWLFSQLQLNNDTSIWRQSIGMAFPVILEAISKILCECIHFGQSEMGVIKTINKRRWVNFLHPDNSLQGLKYFVRCVINPTNPIKIENIKIGESVLIIFATATDAQKKDVLFMSKCDEIIKWLKYEMTVSKNNTIKLINHKDDNFSATAISHAIKNENYYMAKLILETFGKYINLVHKYYYQQSFRSSIWLDIVQSRQNDLIRLAVAAVVGVGMDEVCSLLDNIDFSMYNGVYDDTPLLWAANHGLYLILQFMLQRKAAKVANINVVDPLAVDVSKHSVWEYVTGLPNIYTLIEMKQQNQQQGYAKYDIDCVDFQSMKILIEEYKIDVNRFDFFGKGALYRICSIEYKEISFNIEFDKQYQAIRLLLKNGAKTFDLDVQDEVTANEYVVQWRQVLLLIEERKLTIEHTEQIKEHMSVVAFVE